MTPIRIHSKPGPRSQRPTALLSAAEVAELFCVDSKTPGRWARAGRLSSIRTLGGHHRFLAQEVLALLEGNEGGVSTRAS